MSFCLPWLLAQLEYVLGRFMPDPAIRFGGVSTVIQRFASVLYIDSGISFSELGTVKMIFLVVSLVRCAVR